MSLPPAWKNHRPSLTCARAAMCVSHLVLGSQVAGLCSVSSLSSGAIAPCTKGVPRTCCLAEGVGALCQLG